MTDDEKVKIHLMMERLITNIDHELDELSRKSRYLIEQKNILVLLRTEYSRFICQACAGKGEVGIWYAQDDCKFEECRQCAGTGKL